MRNAPPSATQGTPGQDLGNLWTLERAGCTVRCAVLAFVDGYELQVFVDGEPLLSQRCRVLREVFELAECWRGRMIERKWVAKAVGHPRSDRRRQPRKAGP